MTQSSTSKLECPNQSNCGGCQLLGLDQVEQHGHHRTRLSEQWNAAQLPPLPSNIQVFGEQVQGTRSVAEFSFRRYENRTAIGWFHSDHPELQSLNNCPALNAPLQPLFQTIAHKPPPLERCRIRIRVSPKGVLGCWIDAANTEILKLLKEADWLKQLMAHAVVEIGQKHKRVVETEKGLSLRKPILDRIGLQGTLFPRV